MDACHSKTQIVIPDEEESSNGFSDEEFVSAMDFTVPLSPVSPESSTPHELNVTFTIETPDIPMVLPVISPSANAPLLKPACVVVVNRPKILGPDKKSAEKTDKGKSHIPALKRQAPRKLEK